MSLLRKDDVYADRAGAAERKLKGGVTDGKPEVGFILTLVCAALAITVVTALFAPAPVAGQSGSEVMFVGP
jgi:hypothetical protein